MSAASLELTIDGQVVRVPSGITVASALLDADITAFRTSEARAPRGPVCGMGICFECRVTINGVPHRRACTTLVTDGMRVDTTGPEHAPRDR